MTGAGATDGRVRVALSDGVADVRLDRPAKMNALDLAMFEALVATGEGLAVQPGLRAVVLSGEGRAFCAGLDLAMMKGLADPGRGPSTDLAARTHGRANLFQQAALVWRDLPVPVIAAVHGTVFGGGFQIMLGADIRYAAPNAVFSIMEIRWGIVPDMGGTALLRGLARPDVVRELTYTGRTFSAEEAVRHGVVTRVEPDPRAAALATAREIAGRSPDAVRAAKRLANLAEGASAEQVLLAESVEQRALVGGANQIEAVLAGLEHRPPRFFEPAVPARDVP